MRLASHPLKVIALIILLCCLTAAIAADSLETAFVSPPESARPWVYWFWLNGNITREGITADLEAMKRVGIGGALIMEVDQGAPVGPIGFMTPEWRELFKHVASEARRLGLEINMNNDAGWNGSGGPWIRPEQSMQKVVWTDTDLVGPQHYDGSLAQPEAVAGFYRDITVLAFPTPGAYRIPNIQAKARFTVHDAEFSPDANLAPENVISQDRILDISDRMDAEGRLVWNVPDGKWTVARFGHTSTGIENAPAPASGRGLECDKLSKEGAEASFSGMIARLVTDVGGNAGKSFVATHVDSWENGSQNWTARMREEFRARRGYDLMRFLPVFTGRVVGSSEISERFLCDLRRTISEMIVENYAGRIAEMAHERGLRFTTEAYESPCDALEYGARADEPMGEFWNPMTGCIETCRAMASAAHVYGKPIVGAEAFTSFADEKWRAHPATLKAIGDRAFCEGINRFVFHRYAMQPWEPARKPGMMMGPWGVHYERTQTWWELTPSWHTYLARCQHMLRQGRFVADVCYVHEQPWIVRNFTPLEGVPSRKSKGYDWDECGPEVVLTRMSVKDGRIVLPSGMSYRLLVLSNSRLMTPEFLRKIGELVRAGATVIGPRPEQSPSLAGYPKCDDEVRRLASEVWGDCDGKQVKEHKLGRGRVVWGDTPEDVLARMGVGPDFSSPDGAGFIHREIGGTHVYFVANPGTLQTVAGTFRVTGKVPEFWWPDTGRIERAAAYEEKNGRTSVALPLGPGGSVFVVFRADAPKTDRVVSVERDDETVIATGRRHLPKIAVERATYGVQGDQVKTRDVRDKVRELLDRGEYSFQVSRIAESGDPAWGVTKTLDVTYSVGGHRFTASGTDPETISFALHPASCELRDDGRDVRMSVWEPGTYKLTRASGRSETIPIRSVPAPMEISGPWRVEFPPDSGAPARVEVKRLTSLSDHPDPGVKHFSGTATYRTSFKVPKSMLAKGRVFRLDLGDVQVIARVKLNGRDLGVLWKPPHALIAGDALKAGVNELEVQVTNLWPNRLIGDELLPEDSARRDNGQLRAWPQWVQEGKPSPSGRLTFETWRLWSKDDSLLKSGLIGPVKLQAAQVITIK